MIFKVISGKAWAQRPWEHVFVETGQAKHHKPIAESISYPDPEGVCSRLRESGGIRGAARDPTSPSAQRHGRSRIIIIYFDDWLNRSHIKDSRGGPTRDICI